MAAGAVYPEPAVQYAQGKFGLDIARHRYDWDREEAPSALAGDAALSCYTTLYQLAFGALTPLPSSWLAPHGSGDTAWLWRTRHVCSNLLGQAKSLHRRSEGAAHARAAVVGPQGGRL